MPDAPTSDSGRLPPADPRDASTLIAYQDGAIVSRTLAKAGGGTLTVFAFAAGQALSEHTTPFDAFVQVLDGTAELTIGGKPVTAAEGSIVLMPSGVPHAVRAPGRMKMLLTMLR